MSESKVCLRQKSILYLFIFFRLDENEEKQWTVEDLLGFLIFACSVKNVSELSKL